MRKGYAVCVGINDYPGTGADLSGCVNDARDAQRVFQTKGYEVDTYFDAQATWDNVTTGLARMVDRAHLGDRVVFHISSHGTYKIDRNGDEIDGRDEAFCLYDYRDGGLLLDDEIHEIFGKRRYGVRATIFGDACHSGTISRFVGQYGEGRARFLPPHTFQDVTEEEAIRLEESRAGTPRPGVVLISGCQDHEYSYDATFNGRPNGAMTYFLLQSLQQGGSTKKVYDRLRQQLPSAAYPQTPQLVASRSQRYLPLL